ncbi:hypothetical protein THIAE_09505 [Thiomicrospira aerophila AL3]|uniref:DUF1640 domain-containing protein n=1 Tax=Thiomicrospira aerophila AL3 TaxID=717772 RepID=W0DUV8_9GAMM|nr:hypothetical protein [Thiomicrospira aerophila]AHF02385.1 hypothetical protein THIAE_09505 [Thiomicrospira aerophila AL3]
MSIITFDKLELTDILKKTNIPPEQAEAIVRAIAKAHDGIVSKDYLDYKIDKVDIKITFLQWILAINTAALLALVGKFLFS